MSTLCVWGGIRAEKYLEVVFLMMFSGKIDGFLIVDPSGVNSSHVDFALDIVLLLRENDWGEGGEGKEEKEEKGEEEREEEEEKEKEENELANGQKKGKKKGM